MLKRCFVALSTTLVALSAQAGLTNVNIVISAAPPPARVVVVPPRGFTQCFMTRGMWMDGIWVPPHQECIYSAGSARSSVWVSGYWGCVTPGHHGRCGHWQWYSNRWMRDVSPRYIERRQPFYRDYEHGHEHEHGPRYEQRVERNSNHGYQHGHDEHDRGVHVTHGPARDSHGHDH